MRLPPYGDLYKPSAWLLKPTAVTQMWQGLKSQKYNIFLKAQPGIAKTFCLTIRCDVCIMKASRIKTTISFGVWHEDVELFALTGHPKSKRYYDWSCGEPEQFITILELPPVDSAQAAVKVGVAYQVKKALKGKQ